jgi:hypothetical protein
MSGIARPASLNKSNEAGGPLIADVSLIPPSVSKCPQRPLRGASGKSFISSSDFRTRSGSVEESLCSSSSLWCDKRAVLASSYRISLCFSTQSMESYLDGSETLICDGTDLKMVAYSGFLKANSIRKISILELGKKNTSTIRSQHLSDNHESTNWWDG